MCFAFVLKHFQAKRWLVWVAKVLLQVIAIEVIDACL